MTPREEVTLEEAHVEAKDGIAKVGRLFGVSHDTACVLWMLMSINNLLVEQNEMIFGCPPEDETLPGDEWKGK